MRIINFKQVVIDLENQLKKTLEEKVRVLNIQKENIRVKIKHLKNIENIKNQKNIKNIKNSKKVDLYYL